MSVEIDGSSRNEPVIVMTHVLEAPRALVWTAFTTPEHVKNWYGGHGFHNPVCEMDVRPGGRWRHVMRTPDGHEQHLAFVFVEVVKPERLSWRTERQMPGEPEALNTLTLEDLGRRTRVTFVARFASVAERDLAMSWGFTRVLGEGVERMQQVLASLSRG
jgi:uncharacterized protein YndB with AHSA1/START domain